MHFFLLIIGQYVPSRRSNPSHAAVVLTNQVELLHSNVERPPSLRVMDWLMGLAVAGHVNNGKTTILQQKGLVNGFDRKFLWIRTMTFGLLLASLSW